MDLGRRLRKLRLERELTQKDIADPHFTAAYVSTIEAGKRTPSRTALEHFAEKLGVDPDELLTGRPPDLMAQLEGQYADALRLLSSGEHDGARELLQKARREAKRYGLQRKEAEAMFLLARADEAGGDIDAAIEGYQRVEAMLERETPLARVGALAHRAVCLHMKGESRYAIHLLESMAAVLRWEQLDDPDALLRLNVALVALYYDTGLYERANEAAEKCLELAPRANDPEKLANMHIAVARLLFDDGRAVDAERHFVKAQELFGELGYLKDLGRVHLARGFGLRQEERLDEAREHLDKARQIFSQTGSRLNEARATNQLARVERAAGRVAEAKLLLRQTLNLAEGMDVVVVGIAQREIGLCDATTDVNAAADQLREAIGTLEEAGDAQELAITYRALGDLMRDADDLQGACDAYRAASVALASVA